MGMSVVQTIAHLAVKLEQLWLNQLPPLRRFLCPACLHLRHHCKAHWAHSTTVCEQSTSVSKEEEQKERKVSGDKGEERTWALKNNQSPSFPELFEQDRLPPHRSGFVLSKHSLDSLVVCLQSLLDEQQLQL